MDRRGGGGGEREFQKKWGEREEEEEKGEEGFGLFDLEDWLRMPPSSSRYNSSQEIC